jgi:hypothetical protein
MSKPPDKEVQMAIEMTLLCRDLHVLPGPGGLLEQDSYHVWLLQQTLAVFNEAERQEVERQKAQARVAGHRRSR